MPHFANQRFVHGELLTQGEALFKKERGKMRAGGTSTELWTDHQNFCDLVCS